MSKGDNSPGMSKLAGVLGAIVEKGKDASVVFDFGTINGDYSLSTNRFPIAIPASDYLVCRSAGLPDREMARTSGHSHTLKGGSVSVSVNYGGDPSHGHGASGSISDGKTNGATDSVNIARPSQAHIKPGDRVLVAWVENDAVVIDKVISASSVFGVTEDAEDEDDGEVIDYG